MFSPDQRIAKMRFEPNEIIDGASLVRNPDCTSVNTSLASRNHARRLLIIRSMVFTKTALVTLFVFVLLMTDDASCSSGRSNNPSPKKCDEVGGIFRVHGCDAVSEVPYLPFNGPQGEKKCCLPRTCSVAGVTGVCQLNCDPTKSFCVPNTDNCTSVNSAAFCDISKPVSCSSVNVSGYCTDICSCEPETSTVATSDVCAALSDSAICCTETDVGQRFTKANVTGISQSLVIDVIDPVESLTCCHNYCILNNDCKAFALFESEENGNKTCRLMNSPQFCSSEDPSPGLKLIEYFEIQQFSELERGQVNSNTAVLPANVPWLSDCWSQECPISAAVGFRDHQLVSQDVDFIICGTHSSDMILSTSGAVAMNVVSDLQARCPPNYLLTAVHDNSAYWFNLDHYKCLQLSDDWEIIESECMLNVDLQVRRFVCPPVNGNVSYIVGIVRNVGSGLQGITCCPVVKLQP